MFEMPPILLALDVADLIQYLVPFIFLLVWVVSQIMDAKKKAGPPVPRQQRANPPQPVEQQPRRAGRGGEPAAESLREQVDEFLRQANRGEKVHDPRQPKRSRPAPTNEIEILLDEQSTASRRERPDEARRPTERQFATPPPRRVTKKARPVREAPTPPRRPLIERPMDRVDAEGRPLQFTASRLGQRIVEEDAQFDSDLHARFDHRVGTLRSPIATAETGAAPEPGSPAAQLAGMLSSPQGMRQAIVLNEILRRPVDRW